MSPYCYGCGARAWACAAAALALTWAAASEAAPRLQASATERAPSTDGTFTLEWGDPDASEPIYEVELRGPEAEAYELWYRGPATQSFVSGLPDGDVRVRVRAAEASDEPRWGAWSEVSTVPVRHHSMGKALALLGLGGLVFLLLVGYIVQASLRTREVGA